MLDCRIYVDFQNECNINLAKKMDGICGSDELSATSVPGTDSAVSRHAFLKLIKESLPRGTHIVFDEEARQFAKESRAVSYPHSIFNQVRCCLPESPHGCTSPQALLMTLPWFIPGDSRPLNQRH